MTAELCFHIIIFFIIILQGFRIELSSLPMFHRLNNLNDAMGKIKRNGNIKNLTSISGSQSKMDSSSNSNTKLFLLLLED
jgi:hypothetical protein